MQQGRFHSFLGIAIAVVAVVMVAYHLIGVFLQPLGAVYHANTHLLFVSLTVLLFALRVEEAKSTWAWLRDRALKKVLAKLRRKG